ncbi:MAG: alpha/beta fold hydrolase [Amaricoccus sp.]|uniref:alpha/beta fold hydrolase n=1 Tax=Amaricoccus sp. TaxID=1872485 RepID=UPI0039E72075
MTAGATQPEARLSLVGGDGPDLVMIHGFGSDRLSWAATAHAFFATRRVWAIDLPGHGEAPAEVADGRPETLAAAVAGAVASLDHPVAVAGHSLGGAVALHLARLLPGAVSALALIAPAGLGQRLDPGFLDAFPEIDSDAAAEVLLKRLVVREKLIQPAMARHVVAGLDRPGRREALRRVGAALKAVETPPLPEGVPLRVVWGDADAINPHDPARVPAERLTLLPGAGHMPQMEQASRVNKAIAEALAS